MFLYGSEVQAFKKKSRKRLITFENKVLRRLFGSVLEENGQRVEENREHGIKYCRSE